MHKDDANCEVCKDRHTQEYGTHHGMCMSCYKFAYDLSDDDGYCGDCN